MKALRSFIPKSIRSRLAFYFTLTFGTTLILTSVLCYQIFVRTHQQNFDSALYNHAIDVASTIDSTFFGVRIQPISGLETGKHVPFALSRSVLDIRDLGGRYLAGSGAPGGGTYSLPFNDSIRNQAIAENVSFRTIDGAAIALGATRDYRLITYLVDKPGMMPFFVQIAAPLTQILEAKQAFLSLLLILIPLGILVSVMLALWASRRAFSPVMQMTQQTAQIEMKNLKSRIAVIETDDELKELGRTLNQLLDRIEVSVQAQDRFVADASHQLKTPLAIIQGEIELLNREQNNPALSAVQQEVAQLIRLVENLLLLARMDAGYESVPMQTVRLDEIVNESARRFQRLAKSLDMKLSLDLKTDQHTTDASKIDFELHGDPYLLRCLIENLIDNAIKYSANSSDKHVSVRLEEHADRYVVEVTDHGQGLSAEELEKLFQRFQRDPKKSLQVPGSGLGLVIVKRIADLHRGTVRFESVPSQGTTARVELRKF